MKAFILDRYGANVALRLGEMPEPSVGDSDVLVQVHAAAVNLLDSKIRSGEFKLILPYRVPFVLGHDVAGVVLRVGKLVTQFKAGDEVYARPADHRIGTFAELIAIHERDVAPKPTNLTMEEAASIPLVGLTAWQALVERGKLTANERVFIQAGSGGVGTLAIQLAKHLGATVATTASAANAGLVRGLGADGRDRRALVREARTLVFEFCDETERGKSEHGFLVPLHASERVSASPARGTHRERAHPARGRSGVPICRDE